MFEGRFMRVRGICLGCKVNTYEMEYILAKFSEKGYDITDGYADIYIINTCSVTNTSDAKSRKVINRVVRENPNALIVVMGCMIEANKDYDNDKVGIIIGNKDKSKVVMLCEEYLKNRQKKKILYSDFDLEFEDMFIKNMPGRTRAFVKIQDGCENFCSYCIIPFTRGRCRSKNSKIVLQEIKELINNGYQEIVLTGIHTGHYGEDKDISFPKLLEKIAKINNLERLRISSIEVTELTDEFLKVLEENKNIVSHLHIPLQSGSDKILKLMNRKYNTKYFKDKIDSIRKIRPEISITTDIIVGFLGEDENDFQDTINFSKEICFSKIHVFPYSVRSFTKAESMPNQVDEKVKKERVSRLMEISNQLERKYLDKFVNQDVVVLIENSNDEKAVGHTENYLKVFVNGYHQKNTFVNVLIKKRIDNYLEGEEND